MSASFKDKLARVRAGAARAKQASKLATIAMVQRGVGVATAAGYGIAEAKGYLRTEPGGMLAKVPKKAAISVPLYIGALMAGPGLARQALLGAADAGFYTSAHQLGLNGFTFDAVARTEQAHGLPQEAVEQVRGTLGRGSAERIESLEDKLSRLANS